LEDYGFFREQMAFAICAVDAVEDLVKNGKYRLSEDDKKAIDYINENIRPLYP
jgi:hypothetical protein